MFVALKANIREEIAQHIMLKENHGKCFKKSLLFRRCYEWSFGSYYFLAYNTKSFQPLNEYLRLTNKSLLTNVG